MPVRKRVPRREGTTAEAGPVTSVETHPLTPGRFADFETLFGPKGACAGCWCMYFRLPAKEWSAGKGAGNRRAMKRLVEAGEEPGILAYVDGEVAGWCAVAPRSAYVRLERSRTLRPLDDRPAWAVPCFFVARRFRGRGLTTVLLEAAVAHARRHGAPVVEGYPTVPRKGRMPDVFAYVGVPSSFEQAGFREAARPTPSRAVMRRETGRRP